MIKKLLRKILLKPNEKPTLGRWEGERYGTREQAIERFEAWKRLVPCVTEEESPLLNRDVQLATRLPQNLMEEYIDLLIYHRNRVHELEQEIGDDWERLLRESINQGI